MSNRANIISIVTTSAAIAAANSFMQVMTSSGTLQNKLAGSYNCLLYTSDAADE